MPAEDGPDIFFRNWAAVALLVLIFVIGACVGFVGRALLG